jgi:voltage-gated potassium channel
MILNFLENIGIVLFMLSIIVIIYMIFCRSHEHFKGLNEKDDKLIWHAFINRLYFVITTITTIGYGDIVPVTIRAKIITICVILTIFVIILKAFDKIINTYNQNISSYISNLNPINLIGTENIPNFILSKNNDSKDK